MNLQQFFEKNPEVAIAYSGGVDSTFLLAAAKKYAKRYYAFYVKSSFQPAFELETAILYCKRENIPLSVLEFSLTSDSNIMSNPSNRCYLCKKQIFTIIKKKALELGFSTILEGTNASDDITNRPGYQALQELQILSPLRLCGFSKSQIRLLSSEWKLSTASKPAYACLATRVPTGTAITPELLQIIEQNEAFLMSLGFSDFRIRVLPSDSFYDAKLQITESQMDLLFKHRSLIFQTLSQSFSNVFLDLNPRVSSVE